MTELSDAIANNDCAINNQKNGNKSVLILNIADKNLSLIEECTIAYDTWCKLQTCTMYILGSSAIVRYPVILMFKNTQTNVKKTTERINDHIYRKCELYKKL